MPAVEPSIGSPIKTIQGILQEEDRRTQLIFSMIVKKEHSYFFINYEDA